MAGVLPVVKLFPLSESGLHGLAPLLHRWAIAHPSFIPGLHPKQICAVVQDELRARCLGPDSWLLMAESSGFTTVAGVWMSRWDSEVLGFNVAKVGPLVACGEPGFDADSAEAMLRSTLQFLEAKARTCDARVLFARVDARDPQLARALELEGFALADSIATFHIVVDDAGQLRQDGKPGEGSTAKIAGLYQSTSASVPTRELAIGSLRVAVRPFEPSDVARLQYIARSAFRHDHFHSDPRIPPAAADEVYVRWVKNSCQGRADAVLVAEEPGNPDGVSGFITCRVDQTVSAAAGIPHGVIELVAVSPEAQGKGIGVALVVGSLEWFARHGVRSIEVGTQSRNIQAMRLYQRCGFKCVAFSYTFHKWIAGP